MGERWVSTHWFVRSSPGTSRLTPAARLVILGLFGVDRMAKRKLREAIAAEAARLMLRRKATEYAAARKRAARWLSRRKVHASDMPSNAEIQTQLYALAGLFSQEQQQTVSAEHEYHPDAFGVMQILLERLSQVQLDRDLHPEGEALYHSLQVFELGRAERPYDEELLLACLLHDVGLGLDRRHPVRAALEALGPLVTERTVFLIEHRPTALEFLTTGQVSRSLRRSEHFDDLVLLARCDRDGRVAGADVPEIDQALGYVTGLSTAWDDA